MMIVIILSYYLIIFCILLCVLKCTALTATIKQPASV